MEQNVKDLKQALAARSHTATLAELQSRGRRSVRVIRADDVAQMIEAAVAQAIAASGLMSPQEVEELENKSREQFQMLLERRQAELNELRNAAEELNQVRSELGRVREQNAASIAEREQLRAERDAIAERLRESELQREQLIENVRRLENELDRAQAETPATVASGVNADLVYRLMGEIAELKAKAAPSAAAPASDAIAGALQQLTSTFTAKLESLGRKMGVSSAVEAEAPSLTALFKHEDGVKLESNMDNLTVKAKTASGIAANLERLKKLKGGS
ncbi:MAG TPA: hypothetical protein VK081_00800 [Planctomycetota bacterium]|nr:hypothetical protein [Planctomycetota bacterium]